MEFKRAERVAELLKEEISTIVQQDLKDPRVKRATITFVKVTDDLRIAKVYFVCDTNKKDETKKGLESAKGFLKKTLAPRLDLRYMPDIVFHYDSSLDYSSKIEKILKEVKKEDDN